MRIKTIFSLDNEPLEARIEGYKEIALQIRQIIEEKTKTNSINGEHFEDWQDIKNGIDSLIQYTVLDEELIATYREMLIGIIKIL